MGRWGSCHLTSAAVHPTGAAAGAKAGPCAAGGAEQAAVQRAPSPAVRQPSQHGGALDPDQDGGKVAPPQTVNPGYLSAQVLEVSMVPVALAADSIALVDLISALTGQHPNWHHRTTQIEMGMSSRWKPG